DVQGVVDLLVLRGLVAQQLGGVQLEPGFDALLLDALGDLFHQFDSAWMQLAAFLVQEERDRHAPVALARDAPVRATGDHAVQTRLTPGRNELGLLNGIQRTAAQRAAITDNLVHADEPLRGGAVNQRRLVAPAVHVAVLDGFMLEQRPHFTQLLDDGRVGLPDELPAEERQVRHVNAVALHRVEDVVVRHAVLLAGAEVVLTVGRRGVNDAGTGAGFHVFGQVHRREALVERMAEADQVQRLAFAAGDDLPFEAIALQAGFNQLLSQHQQLVAGIDQGINEIRVDVERLVGRDGPWRGGPDDDAGRFGQIGNTERGSQLVGIFDLKGYV